MAKLLLYRTITAILISDNSQNGKTMKKFMGKMISSKVKMNLCKDVNPGNKQKMWEFPFKMLLI